MKFNRLKKTIYILIALVLPLLSFGSDNTQALFEKGNAYYAKSQYKEAMSAYQQILDAGYQSAAVYFNMGNAGYKNGDIPTALLYYEKAHKLSPGNDDINFNIRLANSKITDKIDEVPEFFLSKWWKGFIFSFSANALAIISVVLVLVASVMLILYFFANSVSVKKSSFYASITIFFLGVITIFIAGSQVSYFDSHKQAIIFSGSVNVKSGPGEQLGTLFILHDGTKVNILDNSNGWMKIKLANGNEGWIKLSAAKEI
jgi:tetratricopeptide (TPR) repeat protein